MRATFLAAAILLLSFGVVATAQPATYVNVTDYGASPTADAATNTAAIQSAVDYARGIGAIAYVPAGAYTVDAVTSIVLYDGASLEMHDNATLVTLPNDSGYDSGLGQYQVLKISGSNVTVRGGAIKGDRDGHQYPIPGNTYEFGMGITVVPPVGINISNVLIDNMYIYDCVGDGILLTGRTVGLWGSSNVVISNCRIEDCRRQGISIVVSDDAHIFACNITGTGVTKYGKAGTAPMAGIDIESATSPRNTIIEGCYFSGNLGGGVILYNCNRSIVRNNTFVDNCIYYQYTSDSTISGNTFDNATQSGILQSTNPPGITSDGGYTAVGIRYVIISQATRDFTTIGAADNNAGTEFVAAARADLGKGDQIRRIPENVTITGNVITYATGGEVGTVGIGSNSSTRNITITGNTLSGKPTYGIHVGTATGDGVIYGGEVVTGNILTNQSQAIQSGVVTGSSLGLEGATISNNTITAASYRGISALDISSGGMISDNTLTDCGYSSQASIYLVAGTWQVENNTIAFAASPETSYGIYCGEETEPNLTRNTITGTYSKAAIATLAEPHIVENDLSGATSSKEIYYLTPTGDGSLALMALGTVTVATGNTLEFTAAGTGGSGTKTYSAADLPEGATFVGANFTWTPTAEQVGSYEVPITVHDDLTSVSRTITINVHSRYSLDVGVEHGQVTVIPARSYYTITDTAVSLQAVPNIGYAFSGWSGDLSGTTNPITITMDGDKSVAANFAETSATYALNVSATNGTVTKTPDYTSYTSGQTVTLQATPNAGHVFSGWSGDASGTTNPTTVTMNADKSVTANFAASTYTLSVSAIHGSVTKSPDQATYTYGQTVTVTAVANTGYTFSSWSGDAAGTVASTTVTMTRDKSVTASFTINTYTLTVAATDGTISRNPNKSSYTHGETVTLQATPDTGYNFVNWSDDLSGSTNPTTLVMDEDKSVTAAFAANTYTLDTAATNGSVTRSPDRASYTYGEVVTLTAVADTGYSFSGWSGDASGTAASTVITMDEDKSVTAGFTINTYTLSVSASNGSVTKSPDQATYTYGQTVTLTAVVATGYNFMNWAGDLSGSTNPVTVVMNDDKSVTATFAANTYTLETTATNGSVTRSPDQASYAHGTSVTLTAVANAGYSFGAWSGDVSGTVASATVTMDDNKSVAATFTANAYTLDTVAANGSVTKNPDQATYTYGQTVTLTAVADTGYSFSAWSGDASGTVATTTITMDADKSVAATFERDSDDQDPPVLLSSSPAANAIQAPRNSIVLLHIADAGDGVDANTVSISVNGESVYAGNVASHTSSSGVCRRVGTPADYTYAYQAGADFDYDATITVTVNAADLAGNAMAQKSYGFKTEMRAFGANRCASWGPQGADLGAAATVCDADGSIWVVYHAGDEGSRDIYVSERAAGDEEFGDPVQVTTNVLDQCNADIAVGTNGVLYVVWQDNRRGNWDLYASTSADGVTWSAAVRVADSNDDEINPAIAVDSQSPNRVYVAWEDNRAGNQDIYVSHSIAGFASATVQAVTSNVQDQTDPRIAVDGSNTAYVVWTDARNQSKDIYGAASNSGPWTNVPIVTGTGVQFLPAVAAEAGSSVLHLVWVSDLSGDDDIYYASSNGLPATPLTGVNLIDDTSRTDQRTPAIAVAEEAGDLRVFVCWQDARNATNTSDTDVYVVEIRDGDETNVLVGDSGTGTNQREPAIGVDVSGRPYVLWTDDRNAADQIYFAASTFVDPTPLAERLVAAAVGGTVGTAAPVDADDVSVVIPAGAAPYDVTVTVARIEDLQPGSTVDVLPYEFGPSGMQFDVPVTITIPYLIADYGSDVPQPYWYDSLTGTLTQDGITNVQYVALSATVGALRFQTTHFTPYTLVAATTDDGDGDADVSSGSSGGGGGGCSLSPVTGPCGAAEFFLPFVLLALVVIGIRRRDRRQCWNSDSGSKGN
ncbi:MAG: InlB B-repeat-containing protein [Phycisphaerae bacterium]|nr:InlB B-repeat-containing protein [Phycisphaerae bacterium]